MSKRNSYFIILLFITGTLHPVYAQTKGDVFKNSTPATWFGIDFSMVRYSGAHGDVTFPEMKEYFVEMNKYVVKETGKCDLEKYFYKEKVDRNIDDVLKRIKAIDPATIETVGSSELNRIDKAKLAELVKTIETGNVQGLGYMIFMEDINKTWEKATMWFTCFNAQTKEVFIAAKFTEEASGLGFRNHWVSTVEIVLKEVHSPEYKRWKSAFAAKNK